MRLALTNPINCVKSAAQSPSGRRWSESLYLRVGSRLGRWPHRVAHGDRVGAEEGKPTTRRTELIMARRRLTNQVVWYA